MAGRNRWYHSPYFIKLVPEQSVFESAELTGRVEMLEQMIASQTYENKQLREGMTRQLATLTTLLQRYKKEVGQAGSLTPGLLRGISDLLEGYKVNSEQPLLREVERRLVHGRRAAKFVNKLEEFINTIETKGGPYRAEGIEQWVAKLVQ